MGKTKTGDDVQKLKSRVAAKNRRKNENDQFDELVLLNPWIKSNPPDKSTVIRLTTSFIGLMKVLNGSGNTKQIENEPLSVEGIEKLGLEALDGFVIFLSKDGMITYVNEKALSFLGLTQNELLGRSIYNYVLKKDWELVAKKLKGPMPYDKNPNIKQPIVDEDDEICKLSGEEMFVPYFENRNEMASKKVQFAVRVQCNLMRRNSSRSSNFRVLRFTGHITETGDFCGLVQAAWSPDVGDLPVEQTAFISRLTPDLKLMFCEGRIHRYMDAEAKDIVGRIVYPFYHPEDIFYFQKLHSKLLAKGQCVTEPYRWMNKNGGWVWLESKVQQLKCEKTGRFYMLCVNHVLSAVENKGVVLGLDPPTEERLIEKDRKESEYDSNDAYVYDPELEALTTNVNEWSIYDEPNHPQHQTEIKHEGSPTNIPCSNAPPQMPKPRNEDDCQESSGMLKPLPDDDVQEPSLDIGNVLHEGTAFYAAEFFMGDTVDSLLVSQNPTPLANDTMASYSATGFREQDTIFATLLHSQSMEDEPFNDLSSSDIPIATFMSPYCDFANQPNTMDINENVPDSLCHDTQDSELYTLEFNTQFLT